MSGPTSGGAEPHFMQKLLDNQWALLALGILTPTVLYTLWGLYDVINIPAAP
jgi:hypothetical protein